MHSFSGINEVPQLPAPTLTLVKNEQETPAQARVSTIRELIPYVACLVDPIDFDEALKSAYSTIYVMGEGGYHKHVKLSGGRFVRVKVDKLPNVKNAPQLPTIKEELNFLPAGKIPNEYFEQIVLFFREVIRLKKANFEAHAWILWEKDKGYYISIPKQTVGSASVSFTYDHDALPPGAVIVVDLHSHNQMGK